MNKNKPSIKRVIRKYVCCKCSGKGNVKSKGHKTCTTCNGKGWHKKLKSEPKLCHKCNGDGYVKYELKCAKCNSFGFVVKIFETFNREVNCEDCDGSGKKLPKCNCDKTGFTQVLRINGERVTIPCLRCLGISEITEFAGHYLLECHPYMTFEEIRREISKGISSGIFKGIYDQDMLCPSCDGKGKKLTLVENEITPLVQKRGKLKDA
jgi:DnaJ-class molecular chaperone